MAVPWLKHSPRLGQEASSQTVCSLAARSRALIFATWAMAGAGTRIQPGRRRRGFSTTLMGMRAVLARPLCNSLSAMRNIVLAARDR